MRSNRALFPPRVWDVPFSNSVEGSQPVWGGFPLQGDVSFCGREQVHAPQAAQKMRGGRPKISKTTKVWPALALWRMIVGSGAPLLKQPTLSWRSFPLAVVAKLRQPKHWCLLRWRIQAWGILSVLCLSPAGCLGLLRAAWRSTRGMRNQRGKTVATQIANLGTVLCTSLLCKVC